MNKHLKRFVIVVSLSIVALVFAQAYTKPQALQQILMTATVRGHVSGTTVDDAYSLKVHALFLERLDPSKRFFLQSDMDRLSFYEHAIDDEILQNTFNFFNEAITIYDERVHMVNRLYSSFLDSPISFEKEEYIETDIDKLRYKQNEADLIQIWRKVVKHQVLNKYLNLIEAKLATENEVYKSMYVPDGGHIDPDLELKARDKVRKDFEDSFKRRFEETDEDKKEIYFDALLNVFDTHTSYFPAEKKEDFDISISGKLEGIGAVLTEKDGFIKVVRIIPGSASWRQGKLKAEDLLLKVGQGTDDPVDLVGMKVKDAVRYIRGKKGTEVRLTIENPNGKISVIPIIRDIVEIEETYAKGLVIKHKIYKQKYGYIYLPKFYRDFKNFKGRNTTDDIRKELEKLNKSHVDGVLLDLRNNEGGALVDAVDTAGLFFGTGPVVQVKSRHHKASVLPDKNPSVTYDGPLVILINTYSASASEILAAALQDYERAVIVGSESSFGKGTVQTFANLDDILEKGRLPFKDLGSLKITIQKFYRINGGSTQYKGVIPDIILPDNHKELEVGERHLEHSLKWDTIEPVDYTKWSHPGLDIQDLNVRSQQRLSKSFMFTELNKHYDQINKERKNTLLSLNMESAFTRRERIESESKAYTETIKPFEYLQMTRSKGTKKPTKKEKRESEKKYFDALQKDHQVDESLNILHDLIEQLKDKN